MNALRFNGLFQAWRVIASAVVGLLLCSAISSFATVSIEVCYADGNLKAGSIGLLVADTNGDGFLSLTDPSVVGSPLREGGHIGDSDDQIIAILQAEDGPHWNGEAGILATAGAISYAEFGLSETTPLILYCLPDVSSAGGFIALGDVITAYRNDDAGGSGGTIGFACPADPGTYTLAALTSQFGGTLDPLSPTASETYSSFSAGLPTDLSGGSDDHGNDRSNPTPFPPDSGSSGTLTPDDLDFFSVFVPEIAQVTAYTSGSLDTLGYLYGPDGEPLNNPDSDDDAGEARNFRSVTILASAGDLLIGIRGKDDNQSGAYSVHVEIAPLPAHRTDLTIGRSATSQLGDNIYNDTGSSQTVRAPIRRRRTTSAHYGGQNDGGLDDTIGIEGTRSNQAFRITYFESFGNLQNITAQISTGKYRRTFAPLQQSAYRVVSKARQRTSTRGRGNVSIRIRISSALGGTDLGRAIVRFRK